MDQATRLTANQRFAEASFHVGDEYVAREDYCGAIPFYEQGMPIAGTESMQMTATAVYLVCYPPQEETYTEKNDNTASDTNSGPGSQLPDEGTTQNSDDILFH